MHFDLNVYFSKFASEHLSTLSIALTGNCKLHWVVSVTFFIVSSPATRVWKKYVSIPKCDGVLLKEMSKNCLFGLLCSSCYQDFVYRNWFKNHPGTRSTSLKALEWNQHAIESVRSYISGAHSLYDNRCGDYEQSCLRKVKFGTWSCLEVAICCINTDKSKLKDKVPGW